MRTCFDLPGLAITLACLMIGCASPGSRERNSGQGATPGDRDQLWREYAERSKLHMEADKAAIEAEVKAGHLEKSFAPEDVRDFKFNPDQPDSWFAGDEARRIADVIVSFQTPTGGWSKHIAVTVRPRQPGERYAGGNGWSYVGTFDNDATISELQFLARVATVTGEARYRDSFLRGLEYIFMAQYPNGGWPQVYPLMSGYHDHITYNDGAMVNVMELLRDVTEAGAGFKFVPGRTRQRAAAAFDRGLSCLLDCQIVVNGRRTVWCQQHDAVTLKPAPARNYEMIAQCGSESGGILEFLMDVKSPSPQVVEAVHAGVAWFKQVAIYDHVWGRPGSGLDRQYVEQKGAGPIWARYYEIGTNRPLFGDRDKSIHYAVSEISKERQNGYSWYNDRPLGALKKYEQWSTQHPLKGG